MTSSLSPGGRTATDQPRLLLWDIDGTLLSMGPSAHGVFDEALRRVLGHAPRATDMAFDGRTDPFIARALLRANDVADPDLDRLVKLTLRAVGVVMAERRGTLKADAVVHPGVMPLLDRLRDAPHLNSVLTGNVAVNAVLKTGLFGLDDVLDLEVGAFGSDREDRNALFAVALKRVTKKYPGYWDPEATWIIGDTPHDLDVARSNGLCCALVATGSYDYDTLAALDPDAVFTDLSETNAVLEALGLEV